MQGRATPRPLLPDQFELLESIGSGTYGRVYKAYQKNVARIVAIKLLAPDLDADECNWNRFRSEAKTTCSLDHPNIVKVYSFGTSSDERPFYVMDFLEGTTLATLLDRQGALQLRQFIDIFEQVCDAIEYAHMHGVVHGDIKPANVMIAENSEVLTVKLLDFGIARSIQQQSDTTTLATKTGEIIGTPAYMSPEQCRGQKPDQRSDIYSLACVMYQALSGKLPYSGISSLDTMLKHVYEKIPPLQKTSTGRSIAPALSRLINQCMSKGAENRPQSVIQVKNVLRSLRKSLSRNEAAQQIHCKFAPFFNRANCRLIWLVTLVLSVLPACISSFVHQSNQNHYSNILSMKDSLSKKSEIRSSKQTAASLLEQGESDYGRGNLKRANCYFKMALKRLLNVNKLQASSSASEIARKEMIFKTYLSIAKVALQNDENEDCLRKALMVGQELFGKDENYNMTEVQLRLAVALCGKKPVEAEKLCRQALNSRIKILGGEVNTRIASIYSLLGHIYEIEGKYDRAIAIQKRALQLWRDAVDNPDDEGILWSLLRLSQHLYMAKRYHDADAVLGELSDRIGEAHTLPQQQRQELLDEMRCFYESVHEHKRVLALHERFKFQ